MATDPAMRSAITRGPPSSSRATDAIVERQAPAADRLGRLVALAGDHDDVARTGGVQAERDRRPPVGLDDDGGRGEAWGRRRRRPR